MWTLGQPSFSGASLVLRGASEKKQMHSVEKRKSKFGLLSV